MADSKSSRSDLSQDSHEDLFKLPTNFSPALPTGKSSRQPPQPADPTNIIQVLMNEIIDLNRRVDALEQQVDDQKSKHATGINRLLRELVNIEKRAVRAEFELELWRSGRIKLDE